MIPCGHQNRKAGALQALSGPQKRQVRTSDSQGCACLKTDLRMYTEPNHENEVHVGHITPVRQGFAAIATNLDFFNPHKDGVGTLWPNLNRLSRLVPCGKGDFTFTVKPGNL